MASVSTFIMSPSPRVWFSASTGFGYLLTCYALDQGEIVVATMRNPSSSDLTTKYPGDKLLVLKLDVTDSQAISSTFASARAKYGRIDVVFNNAGSGFMCEFENTPEEMARAMFDANFWGACNVTKEAIKAFRENVPQGGKLLQMSSSEALLSSPGVSFYAASKAALESVTEAIVQELDPNWNIKITVFEVGPFRTASIGSNMPINMPILPPSPPYTSSPAIGANPSRQFTSSGELEKVAGDPVKAVKIFYEISTRDQVEAPKSGLNRVILHSFAVEGAKSKVESIRSAAEAYEKEWKEWL